MTAAFEDLTDFELWLLYGDDLEGVEQDRDLDFDRESERSQWKIAAKRLAAA